jgi:hypothetical protein
MTDAAVSAYLEGIADVVGSVDANRCVEAEAAAGLPGEHVLDGAPVEQATAQEESEHAALQLRWRPGRRRQRGASPRGR